MFELYSICFCAMLSLSQVDPPKIFVFLCWRLSIIPPLMITGIRDSSDLTNRDTAMVNTDQSEEWRVENLRAWEQLQEKCSKNILREWQKNYVYFRINWSFYFVPILCLSEPKENCFKAVCAWWWCGANCIWQDTRCDVWCGCCALLPPSASVSCSEYRTRFSYTHQISENRYIQSHTASLNESEL